MIQRLMTYDGGQPVYASDLAFMQDAFQKTVNELCRGFGDTYILYGAADESRANCIAGAVVIGGEIYSVPPELGALGQNMLCFRYADTDERTFYDASQKKVKRACEAYLSTDTSGAVAYIDLKTAVRINQAFNDAMAYIPRTYQTSDAKVYTSAIRSVVEFTFQDMSASEGDMIVFYAHLSEEGKSYGTSGILDGLSSSCALYLPDGAAVAQMSGGSKLTISKEESSSRFTSPATCRVVVIKKNKG